MSEAVQNFKFIEGAQAKMKALGFYDGDVDGIAGELMEKGFSRLIARVTPATVSAPRTASVDARSEKNISTLLSEVRPLARQLILNAAKQGFEIKVTSGTRTFDEQNELWAQGRSKPGKVVTNAKGGQSNHNFGIAFDVTLFKDGAPVYESSIYKFIGTLGKSLGLTWGGDWKFQDEPHFQLTPSWAVGMSESEMLAELRTRHPNGYVIA
jgi:peptidoglycan LD-endopeptidase CwlK